MSSPPPPDVDWDQTILPSGEVEEDSGAFPPTSADAWGALGQWNSRIARIYRKNAKGSAAGLAVIIAFGGWAAALRLGTGDLGALVIAAAAPLGFLACMRAFWPDELSGEAGSSMMHLPPEASTDDLVRERLKAAAGKVGLKVLSDREEWRGRVFKLDRGFSVRISHPFKGWPNRMNVNAGGVNNRETFARLKGRLYVEFVDPTERGPLLDEEE
jgi:hypothetical protein